MVSLKMTPKEAKAEGYGNPAEIKPPEYPWGTCITLTDEAAREMFPNGLPDVGTEFDIAGKVHVKGKNETEIKDEAPRLSIDLQITDLDIPNAQPKAAASDVIYGTDGPKN